MPFPAAALAAALDTWLVDRVTLQAPSGLHASATWTTQATGVPCRRDLATGNLVAAMAPFSGGVTGRRAWQFWFRADTVLGQQWQITDEASGQRYQVQSTDRGESEPAFIEVVAEEVA